MTFTVREVCQRYGVTDQTVLGWINGGVLVAINVAGVGTRQPKWRITADALEEFERKRSSSSKQPPKHQARKPRRTPDDPAVIKRY